MHLLWKEIFTHIIFMTRHIILLFGSFWSKINCAWHDLSKSNLSYLINNNNTTGIYRIVASTSLADENRPIPPYKYC